MSTIDALVRAKYLGRLADAADRIADALERANEIAEAKPKITEAEIRAASGDALLRIAEKVGLDLWAERHGIDMASAGDSWLRARCLEGLAGQPMTDADY